MMLVLKRLIVWDWRAQLLCRWCIPIQGNDVRGSRSVQQKRKMGDWAVDISLIRLEINGNRQNLRNSVGQRGHVGHVDQVDLLGRILHDCLPHDLVHRNSNVVRENCVQARTGTSWTGLWCKVIRVETRL